jgi:hypothetical protein
VQAQQARVDAAAAKAADAQEAKDAPRSAFVPLVIKGLQLSEFSMVEETSLKSVLAQYAGAVCTPDPKKGKNTNKYDKCTVREAWVQRIGKNVTTPLADGTGIVVYAKVTTNESAAVPTAATALSNAIQGGSFLNELRKSGGAFTRRAAALSVAPYTASEASTTPTAAPTMVPTIAPTETPTFSSEASNKLGTLPPSPPPTISPVAPAAPLLPVVSAASGTATPGFAAATVAAIIAARALNR